jgi:hypothetical protein
MSRKIDRFIAELIAEDMADISKMKKTELKGLVRELLENNYRELTNETIIELYENNFNTVVL